MSWTDKDEIDYQKSLARGWERSFWVLLGVVVILGVVVAALVLR